MSPATHSSILLLVVLAALAGCVKQKPSAAATNAAADDESKQTAPADDPLNPAPPARTETEFFGATLRLLDTQGRPLECRGIAKSDENALVQRVTDKQQFVITAAQLAPESRAMLLAYPDTRVAELEAFVDARDYAEARRSVKVEMISASWCGWCTKAKQFFAADRIVYQAYDYESSTGKKLKAEWQSESLPTFKVGETVIRGYSEEAVRDALVSEYRKRAAAKSGA